MVRPRFWGAPGKTSNGAELARYYLGVDGGGTNCRVRIADENLRTLGEATIREASNLQIEAGDAAYQSIGKGVEQALAQGALAPDVLQRTYACFCMAGGRSESSRNAFAGRSWPFAGVRVYDDIDAAHAGALGGEEGAVIIAGTGSAALAIVDGKRYQCGGWGFHVGDQMSGAILGRELLRRAYEAREGLVEGSPLTEAALRATPSVAEQGNLKILTSCPSCLQGLSRYAGDLSNGLLEADYIVVEMANRILGPDWMPEYVARANDGGIGRVRDGSRQRTTGILRGYNSQSEREQGEQSHG